MRVLVVGASGLIGSALSSHLLTEGQEVVGIGRGRAEPGLNAMSWITLDLATAGNPEHWVGVLTGIDAVVNCTGVLQDSPGNSTESVHHTGVAALFRACERLGVRRVVHLSAAGIGEKAPSAFSRSKRAGEQALMALDLDWVILRPSVVVGRAAYGGSALMRGLASLPLLPIMPATGPLQIVHLDDLIHTITFLIKPTAPARLVLDVVGPYRYRFEEAIGLLRQWMRWPPARHVPLPRWLAWLLYRLGDAVALLGWKPPVRTTAKLEMVRGAVGDPEPLRRVIGLQPQRFEAALAREPASVQERWFSRLYMLKPLVFAMFASFWIATGLISLGPGWQRGVSLVMDGGVSAGLARTLVLAGGLADIVIGLAIAIRPTARLGLYAALAISFAYAIIGTVLLPELWLDPLGPMLKIGPIMVFNLVALAILEDR
ncbi:MAG: SDR family oxidoreductase [Hyphomicrobiales bacterium]|nr:SDR family oxidoreductase [Hyphomicrobiales bacterium]